MSGEVEPLGANARGPGPSALCRSARSASPRYAACAPALQIRAPPTVRAFGDRETHTRD